VSRCAGAYLNGCSRVPPLLYDAERMTTALAKLRADVARDDVVRAIEEYDRLGPQRFFSEHGFGPSRSYELVWEERRYPHKAILGTAYEFATGRRLGSADFEGGKRGAVAVLGELGFTVEDKR
jgi:hypothetical protein